MAKFLQISMNLSMFILQVIAGHEMKFKIEIDLLNYVFCDVKLSMSKIHIGGILLM